MNTKSKKINNSIKMLMIDLCISLIAIFLDQITKIHIRKTLPVSSGYDVIPGILQILHHENPGASWGMMKGQTTLFLVIAVVVVIGLGIFATRIPQEKKYLPMNLATSLILAGAIGNTIDRIMKKTVTDFIYVSCINFPIFNVADMYIVVATFGIAAMVIFVYKEDDLQFMDFGRKADKSNADSGKESDKAGED